MSSIVRIEVLIALVVLALPAHAGEQVRHYGPDGRSIGTAAPTSGGTTRYYDARGRSTGTSTKSGGTTTVYDSRGRVVGRAQGNNR
jgi:YD repeat-containing protein